MSERMSFAPERKLWFDGANHTADGIVIHPAAAKVLLIKRKTGEWALPGGFVDNHEPPYDAAVREVKEETAVTIGGDAPLVFRGIVDDPRNSDTAWIETSAYLFVVDAMSEPKGCDDADAAKWYPLNDLPRLYASHAAILAQALDYLTAHT